MSTVITEEERKRRGFFRLETRLNPELASMLDLLSEALGKDKHTIIRELIEEKYIKEARKKR